MDENQTPPNKEGVKQKAITNSVLKQCVCKTVYLWKINH